LLNKPFSYCGGGDLLIKMSQVGMWEESKVRMISKQILSALSYCHSCKIAHRDMKPENIAFDITEDPSKVEIKLLDFGVSSIIRPDAYFKEQAGSVSPFISYSISLY
jgi:serine/threonine protein kinase